MSQEFQSDFDDIGRTRSGKKYKVDFSSPIVQIILDNRVTVPQKEQKGVSLTTLIPHRKISGLRTIP